MKKSELIWFYLKLVLAVFIIALIGTMLIIWVPSYFFSEMFRGFPNG
jgi:hypothetical protein